MEVLRSPSKYGGSMRPWLVAMKNTCTQPSLFARYVAVGVPSDLCEHAVISALRSTKRPRMGRCGKERAVPDMRESVCPAQYMLGQQVGWQKKRQTEKNTTQNSFGHEFENQNQWQQKISIYIYIIIIIIMTIIIEYY